MEGGSKGLVFVIAVAVVFVLAGCSSDGPVSQPTTTYQTIPLTSSGDPGSATSAEAPDGPTDADPDGAANPFLGEWHVHGSELRILSDTAGRQIDYSGQESWTTELELTLSPDRTTLEAEVVESTYLNSNGEIEPDPYPESSFVPGDRYVLRFKAPHLLEVVDIRTENDVIGNPRWCGARLSDDLATECGA